MKNAHQRYKSYMLTVLSVILAFNFVDRVALGLVQDDIKVDLGLSDTELGLISGIAFALFYSLLGIPIARWADRGNRVAIITLTTALWSMAVVLCGAAGSFLQLMLIRMGVGIGEAGCAPPASSLIADFFTRAERPRAVSIYMQGVSASSVMGYLVAGWLNEFYGWRMMFVMIGLPGLALAVLARLSLKEPRRDNPCTMSTLPPQPSLRAVCVTLWTNVTFRQLLYAYSAMLFFSYGILQWTPAFFIRSFGLKSGELGSWLAITIGLGGILGTYYGGEWAARRAVHNERLQLQAMTAAIGVSGVFNVFVYLHFLAPNESWAFAWLGVCSVVGATINGPLLAVIQTLVPGHMRATATALVYLCGNLVGLGLGPWAAGVLTDAMRPWVGEDSLRYALLTLCPGYLWVAWHLWKASQSVDLDLKRIERFEDSAHPRHRPNMADARVGALTSKGPG